MCHRKRVRPKWANRNVSKCMALTICVAVVTISDNCAYGFHASFGLMSNRITRALTSGVRSSYVYGQRQQGYIKMNPQSENGINDNSKELHAKPIPKQPTSLQWQSSGKSYDTALCIVPEDSAWDTLQRARHLIRDETLYVWPPAIRLFHPFVLPADLSNVALDVASQVIENFNITKFEITLSRLVILPFYALDSDGKVVGAAITTSLSVNEQDDKRMYSKDLNMASLDGQRQKGYNEAKELIAKEEIKGKIRLEKRKLKEKVQVSDNQPARPKYQGPCILCLEPDEESSKHLRRLRAQLQKALFPNHKAFDIGASTMASTRRIPASTLETRSNPPSYRPVITLGKFSSLTDAYAARRRLEGIWEPLTITVKDLHFVCLAGMEAKLSALSDGTLSSAHEVQLLYQSKKQFNCDSIVSFIGEGEEEPVATPNHDDDQASVDELIDFMLQEGMEDGAIINLDDLFSAKQAEAKEKARLVMEEAVGKRAKRRKRRKKKLDDEHSLIEDDDLLALIPEEVDDWNEGATIKIGRTQFFMGGMREYVGMPASNPMDQKDRIIGSGSVSGAARRKGTVHRTGSRWIKGDYGSKDSDDGS